MSSYANIYFNEKGHGTFCECEVPIALSLAAAAIEAEDFPALPEFFVA